jgi:hypothetical protein
VYAWLCNFCQSSNQYIGPNPKDNQEFLDYPTGQILGNLILHSDYAASVMQSKSTSMEVLKHKYKAPGHVPGLQQSNVLNW